MTRLAWSVVVAVGFSTVVGCGGSGGGTGLEAQLQGSWTSPCQTFGTGSEQGSVTFSGLRTTSTFRSYPTTTCTGTPSSTETSTGSFSIGVTVQAPLGSRTVTAYKVNGTNDSLPGQTFFDLAYVDTTVIPNRLYTGDTSGTNDGSTDALRPTALDDSSYYARN
jgi:hypothetical protein